MSNGQRQAIQLPFPLRGLDETWAFDKQPEGTAADALNVRPFDAIDHRLRGGQRDGLSKYLTDAVNGSNHIQRIDQATLALNPSDIVVDTQIAEDDFSGYTIGNFLHSEAPTYWQGYDGTLTVQNDAMGLEVAAGDEVTSFDADSNAEFYVPDITPGEAYIIKGTLSIQAAGFGNYIRASVYFRVDRGDPTATWYAVRFIRYQGVTPAFQVYLRDNDASDASAVVTIQSGAGITVDERAFEIRVNASVVNIYVADIAGAMILHITHTLAEHAGNSGFAIGTAGEIGEQDRIQFHSWEVWSGKVRPTLRDVKLIIVSGGSIYTGDKDEVLITTNGNGVMSDTRWIDSIEAFQRTYLCDGFFGNYTRLIHSTRTCDDWAAAVTAHIGGTALPRGTTDNTLGARYGTLYRGRVVLWGLYEEPQNWFMSAVGEPLDWDYAPATTSATMAVAGNNSDAGELGDVIIACAPYSDDLMLMGGDHTLWIMRGDPAAGGVIDNISYQTGICSPKAFAWSPEGELYFVGAGQLWRMAAGGTQPESISQKRLDKTFQEIDLAVYRVELIWDRQRQGLHIFLIPNAEPAADAAPTHIYWDRRTDGFWKDEYPEAMGPTAVHTFDADDPNDRALLLGGWDSYIRYVNDGQKSDDGTAIGSYVYYTPIMPWGPLVEGRLIELKATLSIDSDPVQIFVSGGPSADYVTLESPTKYSRALLPGQNPTMRQRVNGTAFQVRLFSRGEIDETWAIETLTGIFKSGGRSRRRGLI